MVALQATVQGKAIGQWEFHGKSQEDMDEIHGNPMNILASYLDLDLDLDLDDDDDDDDDDHDDHDYR